MLVAVARVFVVCNLLKYRDGPKDPTGGFIICGLPTPILQSCRRFG